MHLSDCGEPGKVVGRREVPELGVTQVVLSNGVRVNLKKSGFEKNSVGVLACFGNGLITMPQEKPGLEKLAVALINGGGLGKQSEDELQRVLAGRNVGLEFGIEEWCDDAHERCFLV